MLVSARSAAVERRAARGKNASPPRPWRGGLADLHDAETADHTREVAMTGTLW